MNNYQLPEEKPYLIMPYTSATKVKPQEIVIIPHTRSIKGPGSISEESFNVFNTHMQNAKTTEEKTMSILAMSAILNLTN